MAEVFLGYDDLLHRPVAIKRLRPQYAADATFRVRFEREAQAAASFSHPNIVNIYDVGEDGGTPYIVMEYIAGETLKEIIEQEGPFHPDDVAILIEQVASALDYAHERGFVHRDIKPQNILVDAAGLAKVVDFGIAKGLSDSTLTEAGTGLGTVHYLSPEQASGLMATPSSDIYSLGVIAYEMLTGRLPFEADSAVGVAMKHLHEAPKHPSQVNPRVPRPAGDIVMRALAKDPTQRFPTAGEFARALDHWRDFASAPAETLLLNGSSHLDSPSMPAPPSRDHPAPPRARAHAVPRQTIAHTRPVETASPLRASNATATAPSFSRAGCASWVVGTAVLVALIALIWFGARLSARLPGIAHQESAQTATVPPGESVPAIAATREQSVSRAPTPSPPIVPINGTQGSLVAVPELLGMTEHEATAALDQLDLVLDLGDAVTSDNVPAGRVVSQDPAHGERVAPGTAVLVHLSAGPAAIDLEKLGVIGSDPRAAEERLRSLGLDVTFGEIGSTEVREGLVAALDPPGQVRPGDTVTILVSMGNKVQIPREIQGGPLQAAVSALEQLGFQIAHTYAVPRSVLIEAGIVPEEAGIEDGDVVGIQDNGADFGAWLPPGTSVSLVYYDASLEG